MYKCLQCTINTLHCISMYTLEYYSAIKKMKLCYLKQHGWTWDYNAKWNKSERERQISCDITYMWYLKNDTNYYLMVTKGKRDWG